MPALGSVLVVGAGITLQGDALRVLRQLGVLDRCRCRCRCRCR